MTKKKDTSEVTPIGNGRSIPVSPARLAAREKLLTTCAELEGAAVQAAAAVRELFAPICGEAFTFNESEVTGQIISAARDALKSQLHAALVDDLTNAHDALEIEIADRREAKAQAARNFKAAWSGNIGAAPSELCTLRAEWSAAIAFQSDVENILRRISNEWRKAHGCPVGEAVALPAATLYRNAAEYEALLA